MDLQARSASVQSILAVDCGTLYTRAVLIDIVGDEYRFVGSALSPTTTEQPFGDITIGVNTAITELEAATGRQFVIDGRVITPQRSDGHGIDVLVASCSAAPALRLVVAGLTKEYSTNAAASAAESTYCDVLECISLDQRRQPDTDGMEAAAVPEGWWVETQAQELLALSPDAVLIAGGVEGGPVAPLLRLANLLVRAFAERRAISRGLPGAAEGAPADDPVVLFAGNSAAIEALQQQLGDMAEIVALPNIQPALGRLDVAPLQRALREQLERRQLPHLPGYEALNTYSRTELQPTLHAVELVTRFISAQYRREVLVADVGAASVGLLWAGGAETSEHATSIRGNYGLAQGLANLLAEVGHEAVLRWLPFPLTAEELGNWALNKVLRPLILPQTARDLAIEHAFAREALRATQSRLRARPDVAALTYDLLVGTGGLLASAPRTGQAALVLLDGLEPTGEGAGSFEMALDSTMLMPALGALAPVHPAAAAYVFDRDCLFMLGPCIVPLGAPPAAAPAAAAKNGRKPAKEDAPTPADGSQHEGRAPIAVEITVDYLEGDSQRFEVPYGTIQVIPLRPDQRASLRVKPGATFRIGRDEPGKVVQTRAGEEVKGGLIGLIVDARGRPLVLPADDEARMARLLEWGRALRAYSPRETFGFASAATAPPRGPTPAPSPAVMTAEPEQPAGGQGEQARQPAPAALPPAAAAAVPPRPAPVQPEPAPAPAAQSGREELPAWLAPVMQETSEPLPGHSGSATRAGQMNQQPGRKRQTAPLIWPTDEQDGDASGVNRPHLSAGRRPQTGPLAWPEEEGKR